MFRGCMVRIYIRKDMPLQVKDLDRGDGTPFALSSLSGRGSFQASREDIEVLVGQIHLV